MARSLWKNATVTGNSARRERRRRRRDDKRDAWQTRIVVNCAGAWAAAVAAHGRRRTSGRTAAPHAGSHRPFDQFPHSAPMIIDMSNGFHFRPEGLGFLLAWNDPEETPGYKTDFEPAFIEKILTAGSGPRALFRESGGESRSAPGRDCTR